MLPKTERRERNFKAGTRVRGVAPGWALHDRSGTVAFDTRHPGGVLVVDFDNWKRGVCATSEVARLRDQSKP